MRPVIRMHACDYDCSAAHGAQWQELELIFGRLLQHRNIRERRDRSSVCTVHQLDQWKCSWVCVVDPRKQQVSVYKNEQTIFSWLLPGLKGYYDMHTQPVYVSPRHAKRCMRYMYIVYTQTEIGTFFVHGNGNMHACLTQGWNLFYFDGRHLETIIAN